MTTLMDSTTLREVRCPGTTADGRDCAKLILKYERGTRAELDLLCPRCKTHFRYVVESS